MNFPSIQIYGNILSPDLLNRLDSDDNLPGQKPKDFNLESSARVRDEISQAWSLAINYYKGYRLRLEKLSPNQSGESETRNLWITPLMSLLGYNLRYENTAQTIAGKTYHITDPAANLDGFPLIIAGYNQDPDKKPYGLRMSPHALLQEYLNFCDAHLFGMVTNGRVLRLLRDSGRIIRQSYVEIDLERMFDENLYADFAAFFRLFHASRMPQQQFNGQESFMEHYHLDALESGTRIRENLSRAVEDAIKLFADGFLSHPANEALRESVKNGALTSELLYRLMLRLVYRLLFLMVIEERNLVFPQDAQKQGRRLSDIYNNYYSVLRLRRLTRNPAVRDQRFSDLWQGLLNTFRLFETGKYGHPLGIKPLNGELFGPDALEYVSEANLGNKTLLTALEKLMWFTNASGAMQPINYKLLNVEEFGSVYEGLLEYDPVIPAVGNTFTFDFVSGSGRSSSGSHYTPEELVQPLIKHSLDYLLDDREKLIRQETEQKKLRGAEKADAREEVIKKHLLSLKVADISCGSGHILLSAARRIAHRYACLLEESDQPTPSGLRHAIRLVIKNCIYGVDKNPLAVELCKVALWLEAHNPGEPLSFLDHRIKCGDSIVGLAHRDELENGIADEAFKTLPGDDKEVAAAFRKQNKTERIQKTQQKLEFDKEIETELSEVIKKFRLFENLPERTPLEIAAKARAHRDYEKSVQRTRLKQMADAQVAQFFIPKMPETKHLLITDYDYRSLLRQVNKGIGSIQERRVSYAGEVLAAQKRFFHWFIEFPEVFAQGGFDCVLGNPPFLGGQKLSGYFGDPFLEWLKFQYAPIGAVDLVTYFFRRVFTVLTHGGFLSLISTNTIAQGRAREDGLDVIVKNGGTINHAVKSMKWPGLAAVEVALVTITRQDWKGKFTLSGKIVNQITPYLDDAETTGNPFPLKQNEGKSFQGSIVLGKGFVLEPHEAKALIAKDPRNKDVLFPYLNGDDLNNNPDQSHSRWVINFFDWPEEKAKTYPDCYEIIKQLVKPERQLQKNNSDGLRRKKYWWQYGRNPISLYQTIAALERVLVSCRVSKYVNHTFVDYDPVFDVANTVVARSSFSAYALLQNTLHEQWAWKYASSLESRIRYLNVDCIDTFPFPQNSSKSQKEQFQKEGEAYYKHRRQLMLSMQLGLTKTYNAFHAPEVQPGITTAALQGKDKKAIEKQYGKEVWNLWNHLQRTPGACTIEEAIAGIVHLRQLHVQMDNAVLEAYGWGEKVASASSATGSPGTEPVEVPSTQPAKTLATEPVEVPPHQTPINQTPINLNHNFYEIDYLPENDRIRYTIHPDARKEVLKRLLQLNHQLFEQEALEGLHKEETVRKFYEQKGTAIPEEVSKWFRKGKEYKKPKTIKANVNEANIGYGNLFTD
ncbi:MAG: restriction endonuclease [Bacteroidales bacterium]|nr:restriction endonuclease [Bacteroidales bacterium]